MRDNFDNCMTAILPYEGGFGDDPNDRGNWTSGKIGVGENRGTKYGISAMAEPGVDIKNLTKTGAIQIYRTKYAPPVAFDAQPYGVDLVVLDIAINSGPSRALSLLGRALGTDLKTASALSMLAQEYKDKIGLVKSICAKRAAFYRSISTFSRYGKGWLRRNAGMEATGVAMTMRLETPEKVKERLQREAAIAENARNTHSTATGATAAGGTIKTATSDTWHFDWTTMGEIAVLVIVVGAVIYFTVKALQHNERTKAYLNAAKGIVV